MEEEEEYVDHRTPIGKLIKALELKCKKPVIDDSLSEILDQFSSISDIQRRYLENGIFQVNFAQGALFLQSAVQYYSKRVDKLWDELLEYHTRLVQYDHNHAKETRDQAKKISKDQELQKLEERINRFRRKKIQLVNPESSSDDGDTEKLYKEVFGEDDNTNNKDLEPDNELYQSWAALENKEPDKTPKSIKQFSSQVYKLKNYGISGKDFEIYDLDDPDELNCKYSKAPSYHIIKHLLEYNDKCLLPDKNNTIAKLRIAYNVKAQYLFEKKIPFDTPYATYKDGFEKFVEEFYKKEERRIQNMPQSTKEEVLNFFKVLVKREEAALKARSLKLMTLSREEKLCEPSVTFESLIQDPLTDEEMALIKKPSSQVENNTLFPMASLLPPLDLPESSRFGSGCLQNSFNTSQNVTDTETLETTTEKETSTADSALQKDSSDSKLRSDSGYFDFGFDNDEDGNQSFEDKNIESSSQENVTTENSQGIGLAEGENPVADTNENRESSSQKSSENSEITEVTNMENEDLINNNECNKENDSTSCNVNNDRNVEISKPLILQSIIIPKPNKIPPVKPAKIKVEKLKSELKRKLRKNCEDVGDVKRRRLSEKAITKLSQSIIPPVKEMKWEKFFSMTYRPEMGEGEVAVVEYESESDDEPDDHQDKADEEIENIVEITPPPPNDDTCHSDHEYAKTPSPRPTDHHSDHDFTPCDAEHSDNEEESTLRCSQDSGIGLSQTSTVFDPQNSEVVSEPQNNSDIAANHDDEMISRLESEQWNNSIEDCFANPENVYGPLTKGEQQRRDMEEEKARSRARIAEWKKSILPVLKRKREEVFDIHEYGSTVINSMEVNESKPFSHFVNGKSSAEVVRYFVSVLQLANTNNVEIQGGKKGEFSNDSMQLKLLSKERYHEHLDDFMAPSEETFRERLARARKVGQVTSTPHPKKRQQDIQPDTPQESNHTTYSPKSKRSKRSHTSVAAVPKCLNFENAPTIQSQPAKKIKIILHRHPMSQNETTTEATPLDLPRHTPSESSGVHSSRCSMSPFDYDRPSTSRVEIESPFSIERPLSATSDYEVQRTFQEMKSSNNLFDEIISWKACRIARRLSSTSDSGIMQSPVTDNSIVQSPISEELFRENSYTPVRSGRNSLQSSPYRDY